MFSTQLRALVVYGVGGGSDVLQTGAAASADEDKAFAYLHITLPSEFVGGAVTVTHGGASKQFDQASFALRSRRSAAVEAALLTSPDYFFSKANSLLRSLPCTHVTTTAEVLSSPCQHGVSSGDPCAIDLDSLRPCPVRRPRPFSSQRTQPTIEAAPAPFSL